MSFVVINFHSLQGQRYTRPDYGIIDVRRAVYEHAAFQSYPVYLEEFGSGNWVIGYGAYPSGESRMHYLDSIYETEEELFDL